MASYDTLYTTLPILGVNTLDTTSTTPEFSPGTKVIMNDGGERIYIKAGEGISQGNVLLINLASITSATGATQTVPGTALRVTTTNISSVATSNQLIGVAVNDITSGSYGWAVIRGNCLLSVAASCVLGVPLYTTATAGVLDDTATNGLIAGLMTTVTVTGAGVTPAYANNPVYVRGTVAA